MDPIMGRPRGHCYIDFLDSQLLASSLVFFSTTLLRRLRTGFSHSSCVMPVQHRSKNAGCTIQSMCMDEVIRESVGA